MWYPQWPSRPIGASTLSTVPAGNGMSDVSGRKMSCRSTRGASTNGRSRASSPSVWPAKELSNSGKPHLRAVATSVS